MADVECERGYKEKAETTVTVKLWAILGIVGIVFGFFFVNAIAQEKRVTTLEVSVSYIHNSLTRIEAGVSSLGTRLEARERSVIRRGDQ